MHFYSTIQQLLPFFSTPASIDTASPLRVHILSLF
jgi:hypothetical protein